MTAFKMNWSVKWTMVILLLLAVDTCNGQSNSTGGVNVIALLIAGAIILLIVCVSLPICICCLTVTLCCTCVRRRRAEKADGQPAAATQTTIIAQESKSSIHNLPLPPIPSEIYEEIVATEVNIDKHESRIVANSLPPIETQDNEAYGANSNVAVETNVAYGSNLANHEEIVATEANIDKHESRISENPLTPVPFVETQDNQAYGANSNVAMETNVAYSSNLANHEKDSQVNNQYLQLLHINESTATESQRANYCETSMETNDAYEPNNSIDDGEAKRDAGIPTWSVPIETDNNIAYGRN